MCQTGQLFYYLANVYCPDLRLSLRPLRMSVKSKCEETEKEDWSYSTEIPRISAFRVLMPSTNFGSLLTFYFNFCPSAHIFSASKQIRSNLGGGYFTNLAYGRSTCWSESASGRTGDDGVAPFGDVILIIYNGNGKSCGMCRTYGVRDTGPVQEIRALSESCDGKIALLTAPFSSKSFVRY